MYKEQIRVESCGRLATADGKIQKTFFILGSCLMLLRISSLALMGKIQENII